MSSIKKIVEDMLGNHTVVKDGCWGWKGAKDAGGYTRISLHLLGHRAAYFLFKGDIPDDMVVMHSCDNRECCNPDHLSLGTPKQNTHDAIKKGRWGRGPPSKLRDCDIPRIRDLISCGETNSAIAKYFGVNRWVIGEISRGKTWKHVP